MCYTYDSLNRVTARTIKNATTNAVISTETFTYDAAGNITGGSADDTFAYDTNNRLTTFNGNAVNYDLDGNMLNNGATSFTYDSANRLITAGENSYTYNAEDVRISNLCDGVNTTYTYDTNCKLSKLLTKTANGVVTKYVYGRGLIGEEVSSTFKTYHFDSRGSTVAITNASGNVTDTFAYDTYGKCISRTGTSVVIFGYNGCDGVVTDDNGLIYMRARYYSPEMKRFINADIIPGKLSNAITLNRFAYANGNPVSLVDPFGLAPQFNHISSEVTREVFGHGDGARTYPSVTFVYSGKASMPDQYKRRGLRETLNHFINRLGDAKDSVVDAYEDAKSTIGSATTWVDTNVVQPFKNTATAIGDWFEETGEWFDKNFRNKDGSYAIYDNQRFKDSVFHEQIFAFTPSGPSFDLRTGDIGLGSLEVDVITGGWEGEHANLSLLDFGHAEAEAEIKKGDVKFGALASIWSPSLSFSIGKLSVEIGVEVGAVGAGFKKVKNGFSFLGAYGFGGSLTFSWND